MEFPDSELINPQKSEKKKVGRPKAIESPEALWHHFQAYVKKTEANPILVHDFVGKDGFEVFRKKKRCLTMEGFQNYLEDQKIITDVTDYFENKEGRYEEFVRVCSRVRRAIRSDQIEGGMAGIYNQSITQRLNGLVDKKEIAERKDLPILDVGNEETQA